MTTIFITTNLFLCIFVFRDGFWGQSILAPLDIAPALFSKYRFIDPASSGIPDNQYIIDQQNYDLPLQRTVYLAYRRGEIPWWDPYTYGGRPLLADAHVNGTDPVRVLLYAVLPFLPAYNWTLILHFVLSGLGMFLLLRHWRLSDGTCFLLALTYQFAGCFTRFFGHPWIQAAFLYYPFLWLVWDDGLQRRFWWRVAQGALLVAAIFYAGNLQSHAYLGIFIAAFLIGYGWKEKPVWKQLVSLVGFSGLLGVCLAAPVLLAQAEFFMNSTRPIEHHSATAWLGGILALSAVYPWMLGTFRTLDVGRFFGENGPGFLIFVGTAAFILAVVSVFGQLTITHGKPRRTALWLVAIYLVIQSSPLRDIFYARSAPIAGTGLIVLAAFGMEALFGATNSLRRLGLLTLVASAALAIATNVAALVIYPRLLPKVRTLAEKRNPAMNFGGAATALRSFQINNLPNEVSFKNPEAALGFAGLLAVAAILLAPSLRRRPAIREALLVLNLLPVMLFCYRFVPRQPVEFWHRLLEGGPEQKHVAAVMADTQYRLLEVSPNMHDYLLPYNLPHLYRIRTVHGYSALQPNSLFWMPANIKERLRAQVSDYIYESAAPGLATGEFRKVETPFLARFQWQTPTTRTFSVKQITLGKMELTFEPGEPGTLLWTDNHYPGWRCIAGDQNLTIQPAAPCFNTIRIPAEVRRVELVYRPTHLSASLLLVAAGLGGIGVCTALGLSRRNPA